MKKILKKGILESLILMDAKESGMNKLFVSNICAFFHAVLNRENSASQNYFRNKCQWGLHFLSESMRRTEMMLHLLK